MTTISNQISTLLINGEWTLDEAELICHLELNSVEGLHYQRFLAKKLAKYFSVGHLGYRVSPDQWKARQYRRIARNQGDIEEAYLFRTQTAYEFFGWLNAIRLFFLRANREIFDIFRRDFFNNTLWLNYAGFAYGFELFCVDLPVVIKNTFFPSKKQKEAIPSWRARLTCVLNKGNRLARMRNDAVWLTVNLVCFFAVGLLYASVMLSGFVFDLVNEFWIRRQEYKMHAQLLKKIEGKQVNESNTHKKIALEAAQQAVKKKFTTVKINIARRIFVTTVILVGYGFLLFPFVFFPPATLALGVLMGASLALSASVFDGVGRMLWNKLFSRRKRTDSTGLPSLIQPQHPQPKQSSDRKVSPVNTVSPVLSMISDEKNQSLLSPPEDSHSGSDPQEGEEQQSAFASPSDALPCSWQHHSLFRSREQRLSPPVQSNCGYSPRK